MSRKISLPLDSLMTWRRGSVIVKPTDGGRSALSVSTEQIENSQRMHNGRLRKYHVADKRTWNVSWTMLPAMDTGTVEWGAGGWSIQNFYNNTKGAFFMDITHKAAVLNETVEVVFTGFDKTHTARGAFDFWEVSVTMEEC